MKTVTPTGDANLTSYAGTVHHLFLGADNSDVNDRICVNTG